MKKILVILIMFLILVPSLVFAVGQGVNLIDYDPNVEINVNIDPNHSEVTQDTHDSLNCNANIQQGNADVSNSNELYVRGSGTAGTADSAVLTIQGISSMTPLQVGDNSSSLTIDQADPNNLHFQEQPLNKETYSIEYAVGSGASINFAFGFTSRYVLIWADNANTDDLAIDFLGGTAIVPGANTSGDARFPAGAIMTIPLGVTSISAIAASGTQAIRIYALK